MTFSKDILYSTILIIAKNLILTFIGFNFIVSVVMIMRKRIIMIAMALFLIGGMIIANDVVGEKETVVEASEELNHYEIARKQHENYQSLLRPAPPIGPITIIGIGIVMAGVIFLVKSKDQDFLPGI